MPHIDPPLETEVGANEQDTPPHMDLNNLDVEELSDDEVEQKLDELLGD